MTTDREALLRIRDALMRASGFNAKSPIMFNQSPEVLKDEIAGALLEAGIDPFGLDKEN